jgi:GMP synthase (glutamine-hydrolysing)
MGRRGSVGTISTMHDGVANMKVLLIQIRADHIASRHERDCILEMTDLTADHLEFVNVAMKYKVDAAQYERADAVIIGGSGSHSAINDDPFTESLIDDLKRLVDKEVPILGSCWGHQFLVRALGGEVIHDPESGEVGVCDIHSTEAGVSDELFSGCPESYPVLMGHHDRVSELPPGATELAYSDLCRNQAYRINGLPVYGTQFHTELLPERLIERLKMFRQYMPDDDEFERLKAKMRPTPHAAKIMQRFLELVVNR